MAHTNAANSNDVRPAYLVYNEGHTRRRMEPIIHQQALYNVCMRTAAQYAGTLQTHLLDDDIWVLGLWQGGAGVLGWHHEGHPAA